LLSADVMEAISRQFRVDLPWKLLHADDLVIIADSKEEVSINFYVWMTSLENNIMPCCKMPYAVCEKRVCSNSIQCTDCQR